MSKLIRIGTRETQLALGQAEFIASLIKPSAYSTAIVTVDTKSDLGGLAPELETALLNKTIELAVLNAKDLPARLHDELELIACTEREAVNDVLISRKKVTLSTKGVRIGTNSLRRIAFIKHFYPEAVIISIPESLPARIEKMEAGHCDALLMNYSDAHRMDLENLIVEKIETSYFVPAVGQGSIAVVCHKKLSFHKKEIIQRWVNHEETEDCIRTERSFLKTFKTGQRIPTFGYAQFEGNLITLKAGLISLDGKLVIKAKRSSTIAECKEMGKKVAEEVLQNGGAEILRAIEAS